MHTLSDWSCPPAPKERPDILTQEQPPEVQRLINVLRLSFPNTNPDYEWTMVYPNSLIGKMRQAYHRQDQKELITLAEEIGRIQKDESCRDIMIFAVLVLAQGCKTEINIFGLGATYPILNRQEQEIASQVIPSLLEKM